ncbi:MAG TPA: Nif3-like dinuclear metal center hexameric protein, partial [Gemmatimonadales bacterium]|nr:Nif3-like dinuclear metal center hexameric protein [Gemmatimonadales bacterium]
MTRLSPQNSSMWLVGALLALAPALSAQQPPQPPPLTARDVMQRIQQNIGVPWTEPTVDTFKDGDPATPVTGIAVTMMATFDVLQRAAARGANLVITHEPTFYDHFDKLDVLEAEHDSVTAAKRAFIR